jgi:ABC-2 type transport system permease protein
MTLWRLELLRLLRTNRWMILFGVYLFFAVTGPLTAAYMEEIFARFGGEGMAVAFPDPRPLDGIVQYIANASQLGLLAVVIVGAGALAIDARPEVAAFLRTRVERASTLLIPRYVVTTLAAVAALVAGTAVAWVLTEAVIGALPAGPMVVGTLYGSAYLVFAVAVLAAVSGFMRSQTTAVFATLVLLLTLPLVGMLPTVGAWLPSHLVGAVAALIEGAPVGDYLRALTVTVVATAALLAVAVQRFGRREL